MDLHRRVIFTCVWTHQLAFQRWNNFHFVLSHLCLLSAFDESFKIIHLLKIVSLRKQPTFRHAFTGFPAKWGQRNERRNSIVMTCHYPDLGSASDRSCPDGNSGAILRSEEWHVISLEFSRSFLKRNFSGKTVLVPRHACRLFSLVT